MATTTKATTKTTKILGILRFIIAGRLRLAAGRLSLFLAATGRFAAFLTAGGGLGFFGILLFVFIIAVGGDILVVGIVRAAGRNIGIAQYICGIGFSLGIQFSLGISPVRSPAATVVATTDKTDPSLASSFPSKSTTE